MKMPFNKASRHLAPMLLIGFVYAGSVAAQAPLNTNNLPEPSIDTAPCADVIWNTDLISKYPRISRGCREVVLVNGQKWARFEADFVQNNSDGSFTSEFMDTHDRSLGNVTLIPTAEQRVTLDGRKYKFTELTRDQKLNFYIPEGVYGFASEPDAPSGQYAQIVRFDDDAATSVELEPKPERMAQVNPEPEPSLPRLPDTAGPLPLLALGGLLSLLGAAGLGIRRRFFNRTRRSAKSAD